MKYTVNKYIYGILVTSVALLGGCKDDFLTDDPVNSTSTDIVSYKATVATVDSVQTRTDYQPYDPLVLNSKNNSFPLYLHTYEHPMGDDYTSFSPSEEQTRGLQVNSEQNLYDIHKSFGVRCDLEEDNSSYFPMQNAKMLTDNDYKIWTTDAPHRWPGEKKLTFNAIAPYSHIEKLENLEFYKNKITFSYKAQKSTDGKTDAEAQTDLLTAVSTMNREATATYNYRVPLKFYHALSAVKFAVRDVLKGEIVSINISGVKGSGECTFTANDDSQNGNFTWITNGENQSYFQNFNHAIENGNFDPNDEKQDVLLTTKMPEKTFFLIPQEITEDAEIEVVIKRDNVADGLPETITVKGKILDNAVTEWKAGYEYVYTISTSKDNWVYVFDAKGNEAKGTDNIYVYNPGADEFPSLGNTAYFNVQSYRYKANDQNYVEALPWKASHDGSESYKVYNPGDEDGEVYEGKSVTGSQWITDKNNLKGSGLEDKKYEKHELTFMPHYIATDWEGDETMQNYEPYPEFTKEAPYDLSTYGGKRGRTTANCYIVDRGGWYMLPLVYGNALKNNVTVTSSYTSASTKGASENGYRILKTLTDYNGNAITGPYIQVTDNASAELIWQDAYNMIIPSSVEIVTVNNEKMLRFYVERENLQQGNAIVALTDRVNGTVMWSWHIWATEHWLDPVTRLPHVFDTDNSNFNTFTANYKTGFRERGDVAITHNQPSRSTYYMSPYNLGWCDAKKVLYLKRKNQMNFVQYMPDGSTKTGKTGALPIIQDGETIEYKYANNTYYQWGRKDPMRGFFDHESSLKAVFGSRLSTVGDQTVSIATAIQNPNVFYGNVGTGVSAANEDWCNNYGHANLWNNHKNIESKPVDGTNANPTGDNAAGFWCHTKTVYDPSPAGYMVPNNGVFHFIFERTSGGWSGGTQKGLTGLENAMHGRMFGIDGYNYIVYGGSSEDNTVANNNNAIFFSATGNKWWSGQHLEGYEGGANFNAQLCYLWSNHYTNDQHHGAYSLALGLDKDANLGSGGANAVDYYISAHFYGRRAIGRAVRAIREPEP